MTQEIRVIVLDDDPNQRKILGDILQIKGFNVLSLENGQQALDAVAQKEIAVALIDLRLEGMQGLEVLTRIKQTSLPTECILLTGHASKESAIEAVNQGVYAYFQKPYDMEQLLLSVRRAAEKWQSARALRESEERYRQLVETSPDGVGMADLSGRLQMANRQAALMLGYADGSELVGKNLFDFFSPEDVQRARANFSKNRKTGEEYTLMRKDGSFFYGEISSTIVLDESGNPTAAIGVLRDISERKQVELLQRESEQRIKAKLDAILLPDGDIGALELGDIVDYQAIQSLMEDFYKLTHIGIAILDLNGRILVATGWQDICTKFHRIHPVTAAHCRESDSELSKGVPQGTFHLYRCKNNMWDMVTPIVVAGKQLGNLFMGQFFLEGETPDYEAYRAQARQYGFDEEAYLAALDKVPRWSKETIDAVMTFYVKLAELISNLSHSNIKLARTLSERDTLLQALRETESVQSTLLSNLSAGVIIVDAETGLIEDVNPSAAALIGLPEQKITGSQSTQFIAQSENAKYPTAGLEQEIDNAERGLMRSDGTSIPILLSVKRISIGGREKMLETFVDITERKRLESMIDVRVRLMEYATNHSLEELLRKTLDEVGILVESPVGFYHFVEADQKTLSLQTWSTRTLETFCNINGADLHEEVDRAGVWADCIRRRKPLIQNHCESITYRRGLPEGHAQLRRVLVVPILRDDLVVAILGVGNKSVDYTEQDVEIVSYLADIAWEIAEHKRAEEKIHYQAYMVDNAKDAIIGTDMQFVIQSRNAAAERQYGWSAGEVIGHPLTEFIQSEYHNPNLTDELAAAQLYDQGFWEGEVLHKRKDGNTMAVLSSFALVRDRSGQAVGVVAVNRDITERKNMEQVLIEEEKLAGIGSLAAGIAHEINSPLQVITGVSEAAQKRLRNEDMTAQELESKFEMINNNAWRIARIVRSLLDYARNKADEPDYCSINDIVRKTLFLVEHQLSSWSNIQMETQLGENLPLVYCDPNQIVQVLINLITNARDAMLAGGIITIHTLCEDGCDHVTLQVSDTGTGIPEGIQDKIFDPFFTTKPVGQGTGLGLSIAAGIVRAHGGEIDVESTSSQGTTFRVSLPVKPFSVSEPVDDRRGRY